MKSIYCIASLLLLLPACQSTGDSTASVSPWQGELRTWGGLRETLRDGQVEGRVAVSEVAREGVWGVGALESLEGEITIVDGEVWISKGDAGAPTTTRGRAMDAMATVLFAAEVEDWMELTVEERVDPSVLDEYLATRARAAGLDPSTPFPFVVEGELQHVHLHVLAGECPIRARMLGEEMSSPAYEMHAPSALGRLVGIYAQDSAGILCHMGSSTHVHAVIDGSQPVTGHAETVGLAAGAKLMLPRP